MAKYYRYMSVFEFLRMSLGDEIRPFIDYSLAYLTTSKGVCFLGDKSFDANDEKRNSMQATREFIKDCVSDHILVEFESTDSADLHESVGKYHLGKLPEYWMESYDCNKLMPQRYKIAIGNNIDDRDWIEYDKDTILQNPKAVLQQIANQRRTQSKKSITDLEDWCCELSLLSDDNNGWYMEKDVNSKTVTLAYGDLRLKERKPIYSLSFKQESSDSIYEGLQKFDIGNYSWSFNGDIPEEWKDLEEKFSKLSKDQLRSRKYYSRGVQPNTICDYDYSLLMPCFRVSQLMKYAMLKKVYPDIINQYEISFDFANPGKILESIGMSGAQNSLGTPLLRLDTLKINEVGYVLNNFYENNPVFFSSQIKNRENQQPTSERTLD